MFCHYLRKRPHHRRSRVFHNLLIESRDRVRCYSVGQGSQLRCPLRQWKLWYKRDDRGKHLVPFRCKLQWREIYSMAIMMTTTTTAMMMVKVIVMTKHKIVH